MDDYKYWRCPTFLVQASLEDVNNLIRLHFARSKETLDECLKRLSTLKYLLNK